MEINSTLKYGPMEVEISAEEASKYKQTAEEIISFLEDNQSRLERIDEFNANVKLRDAKTQNRGIENSKTDLDSASEQKPKERGGVDSSENILSPISDRLRIPERNLREFILAEEDDKPILYFEDTSVLGDKKKIRQRNASLIILYIWQECYGEERMKSTALKDTLNLSDVSSDRISNMYQGKGDKYFERKGRGPSATVSLTPPGKRQAQNVIREVFERLEQEEETGDVEEKEESEGQDTFEEFV